MALRAVHFFNILWFVVDVVAGDAAAAAVGQPGRFVAIPSVAQRVQMQLERAQGGDGGSPNNNNNKVLARVWARPVDPACAASGAPMAVAYAWDMACGGGGGGSGGGDGNDYDDSGRMTVVVAAASIISVAPYAFTVALDGWTPQRANVTVVAIMSVWCSSGDDDENMAMGVGGGGLGEGLGILTITSRAGLAVAAAPSLFTGAPVVVKVSDVGWKAIARLDGVWHALVRNASAGAWYRPAWLGQDPQWILGVVGPAVGGGIPTALASAGQTPAASYALSSLLVDLGALYYSPDAEIVLFLQ